MPCFLRWVSWLQHRGQYLGIPVALLLGYWGWLGLSLNFPLVDLVAAKRTDDVFLNSLGHLLSWKPANDNGGGPCAIWLLVVARSDDRNILFHHCSFCAAARCARQIETAPIASDVISWALSE